MTMFHPETMIPALLLLVVVIAVYMSLWFQRVYSKLQAMEIVLREIGAVLKRLGRAMEDEK